MSSPNNNFRTASNVLFNELSDGEAVLLDLDTENYFGLNAIGSRTWSAIAKGESLRPLIDEISAATGTDAAIIEADIDELLATLLSKGLLEQGDS